MCLCMGIQIYVRCFARAEAFGFVGISSGSREPSADKPKNITLLRALCVSVVR